MNLLHILADHAHWYDAGFADLGWFAIKAILVWATLAILWFPIGLAIVSFIMWWQR